MPDSQQAEWDEAYEYQKDDLPRLVVEGDSWFAYPMWRNMIDFIGIADRYALCRRGESGRLLRQIVDDGMYLAAARAERPVVVLISGSGNDFVNKRFVTGADGDGLLFEEYFDGMGPGDLVNTRKWERKLDELAGHFETIVKRLDGVPMVTHGYDYSIPSGKGAMYDGLHVAGPWIQPTMIRQDITDPNLQLRIVALMIDSLNEMMAGVQNMHPGRFVHADLRGSVATKDWANEIHPYEAGFRELAKRYLHVVNATVAQAAAGPLLATRGDDR